MLKTDAIITISKRLGSYAFIALFFCYCGKKQEGAGSPPPPVVSDFSITTWSVDGFVGSQSYSNVTVTPVMRLQFPVAVNRNTATAAISLKAGTGSDVSLNLSFMNGDSIIQVQPAASLQYLSRYELSVTNALKSVQGGRLTTDTKISLYTRLDSSQKFNRISDDALLTLVQQQTFRYFWDFAHPVSGLARERNTSGDVVTSGGSGFGIMSIPVAVERNFITRDVALARMQTIVAFLKNNARKFHGAFSHWINGNTGDAVPFSVKDNGADLVETAYLVMGLLTARQYFNNTSTAEAKLRDDINTICNQVEWNWFQKNNEDRLYWHWSPDYNWDMNMPIRGWNEALITYILAASSTTYPIARSVYDNGWAQQGAMKNGNTYYNTVLPLGPAMGGPLFLDQYSFLGVNPMGLSDAYANYQQQAVNHARINFEYCKANPQNKFGYSEQCWGLTASDIPGGYTASSPTNDQGVIAPTAALASMPFTPVESMNALRFFYYTLGDKIWKNYGFTDAFDLSRPWFADSHLAIDQGPILLMIENYRTQLLWNLFMSCPEVKAGMRKLGFSGPGL